jgi:putative membrane protein
LWLSAILLSSSLNFSGGSLLRGVLIAGLLLAIINSFLRPIIVLLSLPAILLTLGLFTVIINGFMVFLVSWVYKPLDIVHFWAAILAGVIIGLVNYLVIAVLENRAQ